MNKQPHKIWKEAAVHKFESLSIIFALQIDKTL